MNSLNSGNKTRALAVEDTFKFLEDANLIDSKFNVYDGAEASDCDKGRFFFGLKPLCS